MLRALVVRGVVEEATRRADSQYANVVSSLVVNRSSSAAAQLRAGCLPITLPFAVAPTAEKAPARCPPSPEQ